MSKDSYWNKEFTPSYTPKEMLELGVFEGKYINIIKGLPKDWYSLPKVVKRSDEPNVELNKFGVKSRQPLSEWKKNGWIKTDEGGWFHWYCLYWLGRRLGEEDDWQISRWKSFVARHNAQVQAKCKKADYDCNTKQRQGLLQWAWDSDTAFTPQQQKQNLDRLKRFNNVSFEQIHDVGIYTPLSSKW